MSELFILPDGTEVGTGLKEPEASDVALAKSVQQLPGNMVLTWDQIATELNRPTRTPRRERFGPSWIRSQGRRGSCNGYAGAKALERIRAMRRLKHIPLSGEGLYAQINGGRDQGSALVRGMTALMDTGVPPEDLVPHEEYLWRRISQEAKQACSRFKALECYKIDPDDLGRQLASALCRGFIGVVAVQADSNFSKLDGDGVVYPTDGPGNHAVGVDDARLKDSKPQFDHFGSWGTTYGDQGRGWLTEGHFRTTKRYHDIYVIRSCIDDPQGTNPPEIVT